MMSLLQDSSEIKEAARLIAGLLGTKPVQAEATAHTQPATPSAPQAEMPRPAPAQATPEAEFRGERLENALAALCRRAGFAGAVVADRSGLAIALYNSPVDGDLLAAFTSVLGDALEWAGPMLGQTGAENISMDINYTDKVVLRRFSIDNRPYFLMVLCPQTVEERSEIEVSIDEIASIMTAG